MTDLGARLRSLRQSRKLTQQQIATACNVGRSQIGNIEGGDSLPGVDVLLKWVEACGADVAFVSEKQDPLAARALELPERDRDLLRDIADVLPSLHPLRRADLEAAIQREPPRHASDARMTDYVCPHCGQNKPRHARCVIDYGREQRRGAWMRVAAALELDGPQDRALLEQQIALRVDAIPAEDRDENDAVRALVGILREEIETRRQRTQRLEDVVRRQDAAILAYQLESPVADGDYIAGGHVGRCNGRGVPDAHHGEEFPMPEIIFTPPGVCPACDLIRANVLRKRLGSLP